MRNFLIIITMLFVSEAALAAKTYQIDLIVFAHASTAANAVIDGQDVISAKKAGPYALLPTKYSSLNDAYYQLHRRAQYQVLGHYVWRQPALSHSTEILPFSEQKGFQFQGEVRVRRGSFYEWQANFICSAPNNPESTFRVVQKQRLKSNLTYYLDNPRIGMLVRIHPVS